MRVAMLGQYPLDEKRIVGGIEAIMVPLLRGLAQFEDLDLHVITCQPCVEDENSMTASGWPLHILQRKRLGRLTFHIRDVSRLQHVLQRLAPDVVHAQGVGIYAAAAVYAPYPHVVTVHGLVFREAEFAMGPAARLRRFLDSVYERYCLKKIENLIAISPYVEEELARFATFKNVYHIENPVDDTFFAVDDNEDQNIVLYAGRVIPRKGLLHLLHVLAEVRKSLPQVHLRVAGETSSAPAYFEACRQFIARKELGTAVTFLGSLPVEQMAREYARCAVFALPSRQETAPVVVAEAMAAGRPVVATRACGMPYMVQDGESGFLVELADTIGWVQALTRLLSDRTLRRRMGERGRELAQERFKSTVVAATTRKVYCKLAGESL